MKFGVWAKVVGTKYIGEFEAETAEAAEKMAWDDENCYASVCHQCSDNVEDPEVVELTVEPVS